MLPVSCLGYQGVTDQNKYFFNKLISVFCLPVYHAVACNAQRDFYGPVNL